MKAMRIVAFVVGIAMVCPAPAAAQYNVPYDVIGGGGSESSLPGLQLHGTIGEAAVEGSVGGGQWSYPGFWRVVDRLDLGPMTEVAIAAFDAWHSDGVVTLSWTIGAADNLHGLNIYRADGADGEFGRVNDALIPPDYVGKWQDRGTRPGKTYRYQLGAVDDDGEFFSPPVTVTTPWVETTLYQNIPNPFNPTTVISFYVPEDERVTLVVYDVSGRVVRRLLDGALGFGRTDVTWDGTNDAGEQVGSGVYLYRLTAGKKHITRKLTLLK